ncbi:hypothetical protein [Streptomyces goshikiensis]|uniref:hypothetical protein n=1 Tax=Streptomyces goshikiensis TaxID=1942 RepID=UPI0033188CEC
MRFTRTLATAAAVAAATVLSITTATAQPGPTQSGSVSAGAPVDRQHASVMHFGYDGKKTYTSPVLDAADPKANDAANWLPKALVSEARSSGSQIASGTSFLCTLWVGEVVADGLDGIKGGTSEDCSGGFRTQWTNAQFAEDNGGWHRVTGSMVGPRTSRQHNDTTFAVYCNNPPKTGRHHYRLEARGYAIANDGTEVSGYLQYGKASSWTCV